MKMEQVDHHLPVHYTQCSQCCDHPAEVGYLKSTRYTIILLMQTNGQIHLVNMDFKFQLESLQFQKS
jgi:hypothetical protein